MFRIYEQNSILKKLIQNKLMVARVNSGGFGDGHVHTAIFIKDNQQGPTV